MPGSAVRVPTSAVPWMSAVVEYFLLLFWMPLTFLVCWRAGGRVRLGPAPWLVTGIVLVGTLLLVAVARATLLVGLAILALGVPSWLLIWWGLFFLVQSWIAGEKVRDRRTLERLLLGGASAFYAGYGLGWLWLWGHLSS
jgi:hypothetical protein